MTRTQPWAWATLCHNGELHQGATTHVQQVREPGRPSSFARKLAEEQAAAADRACSDCRPHRVVALALAVEP